MPKGSRRLTAKQRAQRRRRREVGATYPAAADVTEAPASEPSAAPQAAVARAASPPPAAVSVRPSRAAAVAASARAARPALREDPFLITELRRIGIMSAFIFTILVALSIVLR